MTNGLPMLPLSERVAYSRESNPETQGFDEWIQAKNTIWGGNVSVEFLEAEFVETVIQKAGRKRYIRIGIDKEKDTIHV